MTERDARAALVIHARRIRAKVLTDPQRFGPEAAEVLARARRARDPEALVVALHANAWVQRWQWAVVEAKCLLDEAYRIARRMGLPYVYLGYWIEQSPKMAYKINFRPLEARIDGIWGVLDR